VAVSGRQIDTARSFAADGETDDVSVVVIVLDEGPDDDGVRAFRGLHLRTVQGGCDLKDLHLHHGKPRDPSAVEVGRSGVASGAPVWCSPWAFPDLVGEDYVRRRGARCP
jgi:hypothetical protein